jgi:hypothetical protein
LCDDFNSSFEGWEIVDNEDEKSFVKDSHYWMENKSSSRWMFYHKKMPIKKGENFIIHGEIELLSHQGYGQFGLVWGFDKPHEVLNRFTVSVDSNRFSVCRLKKIMSGITTVSAPSLKRIKTAATSNSFRLSAYRSTAIFFCTASSHPFTFVIGRIWVWTASALVFTWSRGS